MSTTGFPIRVIAGLTACLAAGAALTVLPATAHAAPRGCTITGTSGPDVLSGTAGPDVICGLGGDDVIRGLGGNDTLYGGGGDDRLYGGGGDDDLHGGEGADTVFPYKGDTGYFEVVLTSRYPIGVDGGWKSDGCGPYDNGDRPDTEVLLLRAKTNCSTMRWYTVESWTNQICQLNVLIFHGDAHVIPNDGTCTATSRGPKRLEITFASGR